ncbi:MAG: DUF983 domain-containing protein [Sphingomonadales bacterium]
MERSTEAFDVSWWSVAVAGRCPNCGHGKVFRSLLALKARCPHCAMPLDAYQQADGPAFFVTLIVGAMMVPISLWILSAGLGMALGVLSISALTTLFVLGGLRLAKGILIQAQYKTDAREGRLDDDPA